MKSLRGDPQRISFLRRLLDPSPQQEPCPPLYLGGSTLHRSGRKARGSISDLGEPPASVGERSRPYARNQSGRTAKCVLVFGWTYGKPMRQLGMPRTN